MSDNPALDAWMHRVGATVALVFADIVGSTLLIHSHGTEVYGRVLAAYRARADALVAAGDGHVVSREGDEIFALFPDSTAAYGFAIGLFENAGHASICARVGVHAGRVRRHEAGVIGRAVPYAARVMAHGAPHQVWVSAAARAAIERESPLVAAGIRWREDACLLNGVPGVQRLWRAA